MIRVRGASALIAGAVIAFAASGGSARSERSVLLSCLGMELVQNAVPDDGAPDANSQAPSDDGSTQGNPQSPGDDDGAGDDGSGNDGGANSDQAAPPDTAQPPGCIFRNEPLQLLV